MEKEILLNGRYRLLERIGAGGMASVFKAEDTLLGRLVAIKMLHEGLAEDEVFQRQFQREAHAAANLTHPNIVTVHDIGQHRHLSYIVMEFVAGKTLKELVREQTGNGRYIPINRAVDLVIQICHGIGYAHRSGLVHCDVKPQNVLVTPDERVKVTDFGIARAMSQASHRHDKLSWGTPQYFAPEQAAGEPATPASDVYSIGVILFELLSGRLPFDAESPTAMALQHIQTPAPPITQFNPHVPQPLESILLKVMSKEPAGRYRTAGQLGRILSAYRERSQEETHIITAVPRDQEMRRPMSGVSADASQRGLQPAPSSHTPEQLPAEQAPDWLLITLGIAALIALIGLIPLWYLVALAWGVF